MSDKIQVQKTKTKNDIKTCVMNDSIKNVEKNT